MISIVASPLATSHLLSAEAILKPAYRFLVSHADSERCVYNAPWSFACLQVDKPITPPPRPPTCCVSWRNQLLFQMSLSVSTPVCTMGRPASAQKGHVSDVRVSLPDGKDAGRERCGIQRGLASTRVDVWASSCAKNNNGRLCFQIKDATTGSREASLISEL